MITIDEAVELMNAEAKTYAKDANIYLSPLHKSLWNERAGDFRKIAEWLEDLREMREKQVPKWIPVICREMTDEEHEEFKDISYMLDCPTPDDDQDILISSHGHVSADVCHWDGDICWLEGIDDWHDIDAWMPLPEPYKKNNEVDNDKF